MMNRPDCIHATGSRAAPTPARPPRADEGPAYAELHCVSDFSFLRGAASAAQLFQRAKACGYRALAITDECSLAGIVRAFEASRATGIPLIVGSEFQLSDGPRFVLLVENQRGYEALCTLISTGRRAADKGQYRLDRRDVESWLADVTNDTVAHGGMRPRTPGEARNQTETSSRLDDGGLKPCTTKDDSEASSPETGAAHLLRTRPQPADSGQKAIGLLPIWLPGHAPEASHGQWLRSCFGFGWIAVELHRDRDDAQALQQLLTLAGRTGLRPVAAGDVHMDVRRRRALQDTLTALRHRVPVAEAGRWLFQNGERHLRRRELLADIYPAALLAETIAVAGRCHFRLDQLNYCYPHELVPTGETPTSWLRKLTEEGMRWRWPEGVPAKVVRQIRYELRLIAELRFEAYFLTVHDIVRFARSRGILCQGRGSAANSAVCFALGVTEVDPGRMSLLMERFISRERNEPPDIDIDFEHERREEVFQYIYQKYGRARAALTANVICYRGRSAARDVARALGFTMDQVNAISACYGRGSYGSEARQRLSEAGFDPDTPQMRRLLHLVEELRDHPRHLSQHVGGFVISDEPLSALVPIENTALPERTIIQWNKDDLDVLGLLKVDCLALGMLSCVRKALALLREYHDVDLTPATIPKDDLPTYQMIQQADTIGVFQIESRAQMSMLPRLKPACFYDLVIQVAIVRPGPIQGKMVHPYLRRRQGKEPVDYPSEALKEVFERTLGVPLFQEQVMQLAVVAADYSPGEADRLRRSMAAWKRHGDMEMHHQRIVGGMLAKGYSADFAERLFEQLKGFASYGFPESHAASFALITYVSCWLKCHYPAAFTCALLNAQPMGFYSASSLLQDLRRHGVEVRPVDVQHSDWDNTLETGPSTSIDSSRNDSTAHDNVAASLHKTNRDTAGEASMGTPSRTAPTSVSHAANDGLKQPALRLGFRQINGMSEAVARRIGRCRRHRPFASVADLCERAGLSRRDAALLAEAGALRALSGHRYQARWAVAGIESSTPLLRDSPPESEVELPCPPVVEELIADYRTMGLTLGRHPVALLREHLRHRGCIDSVSLQQIPHGHQVRAAGLVIMRQRPGTASGVTFMTLEDEGGVVNVLIWADLAQRQRRDLVGSRLLAVDGRWERRDGVRHLIARRLIDMTPLLGALVTSSRDFR
ncbi:MAG: error-prone DNA polymerase [Lautropia sp.]|nr:error-prone DNA polymerase [Lautropia sp.]